MRFRICGAERVSMPTWYRLGDSYVCTLRALYSVHVLPVPRPRNLGFVFSILSAQSSGLRRFSVWGWEETQMII